MRSYGIFYDTLPEKHHRSFQPSVVPAPPNEKTVCASCINRPVCHHCATQLAGNVDDARVHLLRTGLMRWPAGMTVLSRNLVDLQKVSSFCAEDWT